MDIVEIKVYRMLYPDETGIPTLDGGKATRWIAIVLLQNSRKNRKVKSDGIRYRDIAKPIVLARQESSKYLAYSVMTIFVYRL